LYKVAAEKFIKIVLELGGSAPGIVLEDADIDSVLDTIYSNRFWNSGQMCDALKRLIVHQSILEDVVEALKKKMQNIKLGDPSQMDTDIGPMVSEKQLTLLSEQVQDAIDKGANVKIGGVRSDKFVGSYFEPTLLTNVDPTMKVWQEEVFGPVLPVVTFGEIEDAIKIANDTSYGLGGYIFGKDSAIMHKIAEELETGMVAINNTSYVKPCSPFGGYKRSGMGREHGVFGFHDLTQVKVIAEPK
jgi:aldehyde dehydrogenase (NAD+)